MFNLCKILLLVKKNKKTHTSSLTHCTTLDQNFTDVQNTKHYLKGVLQQYLDSEGGLCRVSSKSGIWTAHSC